MVQFSSLDEVYGKDFTVKYNEKLVNQTDFTKVTFNKDPLPLFLQNKGYNQENCYEVKSPQSKFTAVDENKKFQDLKEKSIYDFSKRNENMNQVERFQNSNPPPPSFYQKQNPTPLLSNEEEIKRKFLLDKLQFIENELKKYKNEYQNLGSSSSQKTSLPPPVQRSPPPPPPSQRIEESFQNQVSTKSGQEDIFELVLFIAIGFVLIFFMDSIFQFGKMIGKRAK